MWWVLYQIIEPCQNYIYIYGDGLCHIIPIPLVNYNQIIKPSQNFIYSDGLCHIIPIPLINYVIGLYQIITIPLLEAKCTL